MADFILSRFMFPMVLPGCVVLALAGVGCLFAAVVLFVTLWFGPLALSFVFGNAERKIQYQGQTLLEVDDGFMDPHYSYYEYHGPLVRGTERIYDGYENLHDK